MGTIDSTGSIQGKGFSKFDEIRGEEGGRVEKRQRRGNGRLGWKEEAEERCGEMEEGLGFIEKGIWRKLQRAAIYSAFLLSSVALGRAAYPSQAV